MWRLRGAQHLGLIDQQVVLRDGADEGDGGAHFLGQKESALVRRVGQQGAIHGDEQVPVHVASPLGKGMSSNGEFSIGLPLPAIQSRIPRRRTRPGAPAQALRRSASPPGESPWGNASIRLRV
ncbi:hypothetical protein G6F59_016454 [Rhizopus arrhizus]|nr:hypothetical protein G6F59_016454 [Rhizopus arrhizus]